MILRLNNKNINIEGFESVSNVPIQYAFELNTNHLTPALTVSYNGITKLYSGRNTRINLDTIPNNTKVKFNVKLYTSSFDCVREYETTFTLFKYYTLDNKDNILDVYNELVKTKRELQRLKEEGDVI